MKWKKGRILSSKVFLLVLLDILTVQIASFLALFIRYEFKMCIRDRRYAPVGIGAGALGAVF